MVINLGLSKLLLLQDARIPLLSTTNQKVLLVVERSRSAESDQHTRN